MSSRDPVFGWWDAPPFIGELIQSLSGRGRALFGLSSPPVQNRDLAGLAEMILSRRGEVSGAILAEAFLEAYRQASVPDRDAFMRALLDRFGPDRPVLDAAAAAYNAEPSAENIARLHEAAEPRRQELFRRINFAKRGTATLVEMREHLMDMLAKEPALQPVDLDFCHLFSSWFNRGFLMLRSIDWTTPANILEALIRYEAVHDIDGWDDLRRRLAPADRRCFGFFHPQLEDEPLIFVEVALTDHLPASVDALLARDRQPLEVQQATTAVFYSISNCQRGLAGISLGNFLIKQVVNDLKRDLPRLENFVTLSPIPGFGAWLRGESRVTDSAEIVEEKQWLMARLEGDWASAGERELDQIQRAMLPLGAHYLLNVRRGNGRPVDPVARFHLGNGAQAERLNFLGDRSPKGMRQSYGLMVNYRYRLGEIEKNHEAYAENGHIAATPALRKLAQPVSQEVF
ncbi:Malonyl-CoA decarboxylase (plasmid) [Neorhizobium galegae bv. officinalis bv. officinalis str. HAMBI 1141]|uniref:Malonyl-CoA decarboxylase n=1 Tax=Neorhizobium galegae bv. officinalis bv. officinalis str. HAMBI 1141 TaxID=1028801 RepID=A0A068TEB5_NEOGA|nr:malonyl-CoA decarboxylase [Neorhizobium galegae]CDN56857.1 Malonyl-CoA decarboxylase [Neorhizobium galegae bv. officinalis bv. officinalis str. HAMBI 1141]